MKTPTLQQFIDMLQSLPENVRSKEVQYIDVSWFSHEELAEMKVKLEESKDEMICLC